MQSAVSPGNGVFQLGDSIYKIWQRNFSLAIV